jgi:hypothetical protein
VLRLAVWLVSRRWCQARISAADVFVSRLTTHCLNRLGYSVAERILFPSGLRQQGTRQTSSMLAHQAALPWRRHLDCSLYRALTAVVSLASVLTRNCSITHSLEKSEVRRGIDRGGPEFRACDQVVSVTENPGFSGARRAGLQGRQRTLSRSQHSEPSPEAQALARRQRFGRWPSKATSDDSDF